MVGWALQQRLSFNGIRYIRPLELLLSAGVSFYLSHTDCAARRLLLSFSRASLAALELEASSCQDVGCW